MKKIFLTLLCVCAFMPCLAQEGRMYVAPWRETYFNFPSQSLGDKYTLTVFLPEEAVPLKKAYPVVYFLGLPRSEKEAAQEYARTHEVILLTVNLEEKDFRTLGDKLENFVTRDLIPYIDTNYFTDKNKRIFAVKGKFGTKALLPLVAKGNWTHRFFAAHPEDAFEDMPALPHGTRVFVQGNQAELASATDAFTKAGLLYGNGFALSYEMFESDWLSALPTEYLFAAEQDVSLKRVRMRLGTNTLPLTSGASVSLAAEGELANGLRFYAVPQAVRTSPPYLDWDATRGMLSVRSGAEFGTVAITAFVNNLSATQKITLKKQ